MIRCNRRQILCAGMAASLAGFRARTARSQTHYPQRPIRVIVPFAAGGVGDAAIRVLAPRLEQKLAQKLVIESKPGAAGNIGTLEVVRAAADGYTILVAAAGNFVINQFLIKMSFDPLAALTPVAKVAEIPIIFCSNPSVQAHDLAQFIAYARAHRGKLNYGSPGNGSVNHLLVENLKRVADIEIAHIPYRGSPPATLAAIANEIQLYAIGLAAVAGHLKEGKLTALAVTANQRLPMLPEVPTVVEAGQVGRPEALAVGPVQDLDRAVHLLVEWRVGDEVAEALGLDDPHGSHAGRARGLAPRTGTKVVRGARADAVGRIAYQLRAHRARSRQRAPLPNRAGPTAASNDGSLRQVRSPYLGSC